MKELMLTLRTLSPMRSFGFVLALLLPGQASLFAQKAAKPSAAPSAGQTAQQEAQQDIEARAAAYHAQKVQDLIAKAQASYRSGVENYNANRLDAARLDFDNAVDTMLSSGMDLKNDPELSDEFDQILSQINALELIALKQGNGFSPKLEEAPVDAADEVTFAPNPVLVSKVTNELKTTTSDLPLVINEYVAGWIDAFTNKPGLHAHLLRSLERAGKYKTMIQRILNEYGVPQDLIYQAVTESGFQPQSLNRKSGAGGMWQFMPFAGAYGLERNGYFDERFDPEKSTIAYAKYMKFLYNQFGDWYLAMAAYDWGPGRVQHVVSKTGYADYWEIYNRGGLPAETKAYIPSVIAAVIMAKNPEQYGLTELVPDAPVVSDTVTTDYAIDLRLVADLTNSTVSDIVALNPALLRLATPSDISYDLHIPEGTKQTYTERLQDIPEQNRASWRFHVVKEGETLDQIAASYHSHATEISSYNELKPTQQIEAGDELVIPIAAGSAPAGQQRYTLRRSDTLVTVADRFGVTVEQLQAWNKLKSNYAAPGRSLYISEPVRLAPMGRAARSKHGRSVGATSSTHSVHRGAAAHSATSGKARTSSHSTSSKKKKR
jgi:membrane-bound lytic murein transglycosylase D